MLNTEYSDIERLMCALNMADDIMTTASTCLSKVLRLCHCLLSQFMFIWLLTKMLTDNDDFGDSDGYSM